MIHRILGFPVRRFCRDAYLPVVMVSWVMVAYLFLTSLIPWDSTLWHLGRLLLLLCLTAATEYTLGLKKSERDKVLSRIKKRFMRV